MYIGIKLAPWSPWAHFLPRWQPSAHNLKRKTWILKLSIRSIMRPNLSAAVFTPSTARRKHSTSANVERFTVHAYFHNLLRHNDLLHSGQKNVLPSLALRILLCLATFSGCVARTTPVAEKPPHELPRYAGLGDFGRKVTTTSQ